MNEEFQKAVIADAAIKDLERMNNMFVGDLNTASKTTSNLGTLSVSATSISCVCHGQTVVAGHRPVAVDGHISALEYDFVIEWKKEELSTLRLYLQPNGVITHDAQGTSKVCDFNNTYIKNHILSALSAALLASPIYAPRQG